MAFLPFSLDNLRMELGVLFVVCIFLIVNGSIEDVSPYSAAKQNNTFIYSDGELVGWHLDEFERNYLLFRLYEKINSKVGPDG